MRHANKPTAVIFASLTLIAAGLALGLAACDKSKKSTVADTANPPIVVSTAPRPAPTIAPPTMDDMKGKEYPGLHNVVAFGPDVYSGSAPDGTKGLDTLRDMGMMTIVTVDGARPDAKGAAERGMRYVHLPIGYDGMTEERQLEVARAVRDLPKPVYVHCHHGRHRSACAAGSAGVILGVLTNEQAVARMKVSGTSPNYTGLYENVETAHRLSDAEVSKASNEFPYAAKARGITDGMIAIDDAFDQLKTAQKFGWQVPPDHPDLVPAAQAGILENHYRDLQTDAECKEYGPEFIKLLMESQVSVQQLEDMLAAPGAKDAKALDAAFKTVSNQCNTCHEQYRNKPKKKS